MILVGLKNRVEINAGHAEVVQIGEFRLYSCKVAAKVVVVPDMTVLVGLVVGSSAPVIAEHSSLGDILMYLAALAETIGEDLVHDSAFEEVGSLVGIAVNR